MDFSDLLSKHQQFFNSNSTRDLEWRKQQLQQIKRLVNDNEQAFIDALASDLGKPAQEAWITEVSYVTGDVDHVCKRLSAWAKKTSCCHTNSRSARSFIYSARAARNGINYRCMELSNAANTCSTSCRSRCR